MGFISMSVNFRTEVWRDREPLRVNEESSGEWVGENTSSRISDELKSMTSGRFVTDVANI